MATESNHVVALDHFEGGANLQRGGEKSLANKRSGQSLARLLRRFRCGIFTAAGVGDTDIVFDEPLDNDGAVVTFGSDTAAAVPIIKNGTTATKDGFTVTVAAAGEIHWMAFDIGPAD